jgi:hypothetical protein
MKKLYVVGAEIEALVLAESREEAEKIISGERLHDITSGGLDWHAREMLWIPGDWDEECMPFGTQEQGDEKTVGELIKAGAAPAYAEQLAMTKHRREREEKK